MKRVYAAAHPKGRRYFAYLAIPARSCALSGRKLEIRPVGIRRVRQGRTKRNDLAEDIAQETVLRLIEYAQRQEVASIYALGFRIASNLIAHAYRQEQRQTEEQVIDAADPVAAPDANWGALLDAGATAFLTNESEASLVYLVARGKGASIRKGPSSIPFTKGMDRARDTGSRTARPLRNVRRRKEH
jgi:hypothetical protein